MHYATATLKMTIIPRYVITIIKWTGSMCLQILQQQDKPQKDKWGKLKKIVHIENIHYKDRKVRQNHTRMCAY